MAGGEAVKGHLNRLATLPCQNMFCNMQLFKPWVEDSSDYLPRMYITRWPDSWLKHCFYRFNNKIKPSILFNCPFEIDLEQYFLVIIWTNQFKITIIFLSLFPIINPFFFFFSLLTAQSNILCPYAPLVQSKKSVTVIQN